MYILMNKDEPVMFFKLKEESLSHVFSSIQVIGDLPYGFKDINNWLENRKASKHNEHLKNIMRMCGCDSPEGFIKTTHAASLNDTFWVKRDTEDVSWKDISFYKNQFNKTVSRLAFEGVGLYGIELSSTSPELTTNGSFRKCWRRENDQIYLYKRGHSGARNAGLEPYSEVMASELAAILVPGAVSYSLAKLHGEKASKCMLFTDEEHGYVPYSHLSSGYTADTILEYYASIGSENEFRRMILLDAVTFNVDRHAGNHGVLIDNKSLEVLKMAPVFDLNLSLLPYVEKEEFDRIGNKMLDYGPKIGDDFTRIGQQILTSSLRSELVNLKGFEFSFRGDDTFPEWRVKALERMIDMQVSAILSRDVLYTKDVFIPEMKKELEYGYDKERILSDFRRREEFLPGESIGDGILSFSLKENPRISFLVNPFNCDMWIEEEQKTITNIQEYLNENDRVSELYSIFCEVIDDIMYEEWDR